MSSVSQWPFQSGSHGIASLKRISRRSHWCAQFWSATLERLSGPGTDGASQTNQIGRGGSQGSRTTVWKETWVWPYLLVEAVAVVKCWAQVARVNVSQPFSWPWRWKINVSLNPELPEAPIQTGHCLFWPTETFPAKGLNCPFLSEQNVLSASAFSQNS